MEFIEDVIGVRTNKRCDLIDITVDVKEFVSKTAIVSGTCTVFCPHTTAGITINENADPDVIHDVLLTLDDMIPANKPGYRHMEGNSDAHVKSSLVGASEQILIKDSKLILGTWQGIYFCEFDGPRTRKVILAVQGNHS